MTNAPRVSVITGYYNRVDAVEATIKSILTQTFHDFELIAFDDCSTDGTGQRLLDLQSRISDSRFRVVIHKKNTGFTKGLIEAIRATSGEYICIQGSGDISLPRRLQRQVETLDADSSIGVVGCWYTNIVSNTGARRPRRPDASTLDFKGLLKGNTFSHGEVMIRRSVYEAAGGYRAEFKYAQDYDLWLRIIKLAKLHTVPEFLYERRVRFDGVSYHPDKFPLQARYSIIAKRIAQMRDQEATAALDTLRKEGPQTLVPLEDPELQSRITRAILRSSVFGGDAEAKKLIEFAATGNLRKGTLRAICSILKSNALRPFTAGIQRALGISMQDGKTELNKD